MGLETAVVGSLVLGAATAGYGAIESKKGRKMAEREAGIQREHQQRQSAQYSAEQAKLADKESKLQAKVNQGIARGNKRRIKGGLFGDSEPTPGISRTTLG